MKFFKWLFKWLQDDLWVVRRCEFPYPKGYATYLPSQRTVLDTGLTKKEAHEICDELNAS